MAGALLPKEFVTTLLGATGEDERKLTESLLAALGKISDDLVPRLYDHPLADHVLAGPDAFGELFDIYAQAEEELEQVAVLDAIAEIIDREHATGAAVAFLQKVLSGADSSPVASMAARALALAGEPGFMAQQRNLLAADSPSRVRIAAKLLGYGRDSVAAPLLADLLATDNMAVADAVIWALGEIGNPEVLPKLHRMLSDAILVEDILEAVGQIGDATSVPRIIPYLQDGGVEQRRRAAEAMAKILRKNDGALLDPRLEETTRAVLAGVLKRDTDTYTVFYAMVAYGLAGGSMSPKEILQALGGSLTSEEAGSMASHFMRPKTT